MRVFITVLVLIFNLQSWTKADDISEFEIDGMNVGGSLLNYYSKSKIKEMLALVSNAYTDNKIKRVFFEAKEGSNFSQYNFHYINDSSYKIVNVKGIILMENRFEECNSKKLEISKEIETSIKLNEKENRSYINSVDKSGKSKIDKIIYKVDGGNIEVSCWKWSKEIKDARPWRDTLQVSIRTNTFNEWLKYEAYN